MHDKKHNSKKWPYYDTSEEFMTTYIYRKELEEYHDPPFNISLGLIQEKQEFMR